ncbi:puromycin-sensitive aminopeptidase-like [Asterias amurensis]|uniref:puromycin-sensitive aminopeptidase-like n=1 Tax=Asterias amurensis TaxID=7602 RepID=UPI003AB4C39C
MPAKKPFERLPKTVVPSNYKLKLEPDLEKFTFSGNVNITVSVNEATDKVILNCLDINITKTCYASGGKDISSSDISYSVENETATVTFPETLATGVGQLYLEFTGELNDKMKGFYRSKYTTPEGKEHFCAVTQFEATDARRSFPCWDEPAIKASFDVTLVVPADRVALSNMNVVSEQPSSDGKLKVMTFGKTPIMSTYLLAFVVGEFDYVEGKSLDGVCVRVYTPLSKKEHGQFALEVAVKTLPFYKDYFDVAYPLPKIDLIAIPDFAAGAMENWGLVTYRETALLVDPKNSSASAKQWVALVVGHELAHQWFGNLVTMEWWTHLWLNEGFASWIEYLCVDHCFPEYDIWTQFITTDYTRALGLDALKSSHPIEVPVNHPDEVDEIFDLISYSKGSSIIRMLHDYIGNDAFKKGMNVYLERYKYSNTLTEDLWGALAGASGKNIEEMMSTWTLQMGFPVLKVSAEQKGTSRVLTISQSKFCADGPMEGESPQWIVPVSIATSTDHTIKPLSSILLDKPSTTVTLEDIKPDQWIKLNPGTIGFYRVHYSSEMLDALLPGIRDGSLPPRDRLGLENDLFALAKAGQANTVDVLKVMEAFSNETNYTVWTELATNLGTLSKLLTNTDFGQLFKEFVKTLFTDIYQKLGWTPKDDEGHLDSMLRSLVVRVMGRNGHPHAIEEAKKQFKSHCAGGEQIPADLRAPVYQTVLAHGDEATFEEMLKLFRAQDLPEEKERILRNLGAVSNPAMMQRVLDFSLTDEVRAQDTVFVIGGVTGTKEGQALAWEFLQKNWKELITRYSSGFLLSRVVQYCTEGFASEEKALDIETFFKTHEAPAAERTIKQSLENIRLSAKWLERDAASIQAWLKTKSQL